MTNKQNTTCKTTWLFRFVTLLIFASNQVTSRTLIQTVLLKKVQKQKVASLFCSALTLAQKGGAHPNWP